MVALGGGTLLGREAREEVRSRGLVVGLQCHPEVLLERLSSDAVERPLLEGGTGRTARLSELLAERAFSYRAVDFGVCGDDVPERVAEAIHERLGELRLRLSRMGDRRTRVLLGRGLSGAALGAVCSLAPSRTAILLIDPGVPSTLRDAYVAKFSESFDYFEPEIPRGEACKTWDTLGRVLEEALAAGAGKQSVVVGLGGGATLDLAGMVASLLGRGAPLVLVPTTLLAQVDASIGGKCAVNSSVGRNLIGAFHPAADVVVDLDFLGSLPSEQYRSGIVEVLKMGLIADAELFRSVSECGEADIGAVDRTIGLKSDIVERDPTENGDRMLLNLGHTLGHALELASDYSIPHGFAVAQGIVAVARLCERIDGLATDQAEEIVERITPYLPSPPPSEGVWGKALSYIRSDKKGDRDGVELIVVPEIGKAARRRVSWSEIEGAWMPFGGASR